MKLKNTALPAVWEMTAEDMMSENPLSVREDATLSEAISFLIDKGFRAAPVIDESGRPVGVISQSDILIHDRETVGAAKTHDYYREGDVGAAPGRAAVRVRDIMTPAVFRVPPDAPFSRLVEEMVTLNVHRLFVVNAEGILIGVITALDVLRKLYQEARREPGWGSR